MANDSVTRGLRDEAEVGPDPAAARELRRLSELNYVVADGEPDVRGWAVYASTGRELGVVDDLLVDTDAGEVVMLDVDLRRGDRHALAPIRAAWIDHAARRVVLDAREAERAVAAGAVPEASAPADAADAADGAEADALPALPRAGALSDQEVQRFNDDYARAYGDRGVDAERGYRLRRGDEELRFAAGPRRLLDPAPVAPPAAGPATGPATGLAAAAAAADAFFAERRTGQADDPDAVRAMDDAQGIEPRELDARVRIDEGATVDDAAPVGGVRYDGPDPVPHSYGRPADAYGPEYGDGRIGFDKVVSRGPYAAGADAPPAGADRPLRYRRYPDAPGGGGR